MKEEDREMRGRHHTENRRKKKLVVARLYRGIEHPAGKHALLYTSASYEINMFQYSVYLKKNPLEKWHPAARRKLLTAFLETGCEKLKNIINRNR